MHPWAAAALAAYHGVLTLSERVEFLGREVPPELLMLYDVSTTPEGRLLLRSGRWGHELQYSVRLMLNDLERKVIPPPVNLDTLHVARFANSWTGQRVRLELSEDLFYGSVAFGQFTGGRAPRVPGTASRDIGTPSPQTPQGSTPPPAPGGISPPAPSETAPRAQLTPIVGTLKLVTSTTSLVSTVQPSSRFTMTNAVRYVLDGGADATSQLAVPLQRGPRIDTTTEYAFNPRTFGLFDASVWHSDMSNGTQIDSLDTEIGGRRAWQRTGLRVTGGATVIRFRASPDENARVTPYLLTTAALERQIPVRGFAVAAGIDGRLGPVVNRLNGFVDQQIQSSANFVVSRHRTTLGLSGGVARSLDPDGPFAFTIVSATATLSYQLSRRIAFEGGFQNTWQQFVPDPLIGPFRAFSVGMVITPRERPVSF